MTAIALHASLDLLAELLEEHPDLPLAALLSSRPGLFERRPGWGSGLSHGKMRP